eukprot:TRINITY_DN5463_c0_g2_i1.p2 TRINITY_DN5463_c0_g2~~TRINITY_DN5463_c0_g2_i1.p2  ORF type:complete len:457 (+),score=139.06 TRINITY_DN5463_c0_g2_i1:3269-4639(+)
MTNFRSLSVSESKIFGIESVEKDNEEENLPPNFDLGAELSNIMGNVEALNERFRAKLKSPIVPPKPNSALKSPIPSPLLVTPPPPIVPQQQHHQRTPARTPAQPREVLRDIPRDIPRELPRDIPRDNSREIPRDIPRGISREIPLEHPRDNSREISIETSHRSTSGEDFLARSGHLLTTLAPFLESLSSGVSNPTLMKYNFERLYALCREGYAIHEEMTSDLRQVKTGLEEFKAETELKVNELNLENCRLKTKVREAAATKDFQDLSVMFEKEIEKLQRENAQLRDENASILVSLGSGGQDRRTKAAASALKGLQQKYEKAIAELNDLKRKERHREVRDRMMNTLEEKIIAISKKKAETEEELALTKENYRICEKEKEQMRASVELYESQFRDLSTRYLSAMEELQYLKLTKDAPKAKTWESDWIAKKFTSQTSSCLLYTSPSPRDRQKSRMPSSA